MTQFQKVSILLLRLALGWMFLYAGVTKIINPAWSSEKYLLGAKTFESFYAWLASPQLLPFTNFINEWSLALLGISLILGIFVRLSSVLGAVLMLMYYLPILSFPYPNANSFIVDQHVIFALSLIALGALHAGEIWGADAYLKNKLHFGKKQ